MSRPSHQLLLWLNKGSALNVLSQPTRSVSRSFFPSLGSELQMRRFLESLDSEHASSATSVKVKVPVVLIDAISRSRSRQAR